MKCVGNPWPELFHSSACNTVWYFSTMPLVPCMLYLFDVKTIDKVHSVLLSVISPKVVL
jgi:hypothetical protein